MLDLSLHTFDNDIKSFSAELKKCDRWSPGIESKDGLLGDCLFKQPSQPLNLGRSDPVIENQQKCVNHLIRIVQTFIQPEQICQVHLRLISPSRSHPGLPF